MSNIFDKEPSDYEMELRDTIDNLEDELKIANDERDVFKEVYDILMDYFDCWNEGIKYEVDKRLSEIGL